MAEKSKATTERMVEHIGKPVELGAESLDLVQGGSGMIARERGGAAGFTPGGQIIAAAAQQLGAVGSAMSANTTVPAPSTGPSPFAGTVGS